ncbi:MAG: tyrosine-type recombinase/integrase [archaeon]
MRDDHLYNKEQGFRFLCERVWPEEHPGNTRRRTYTISPANSLLIKKFKVSLENANYGVNRKHRLIESIALLAELHGKDFETTTKEDIKGENGLQSKIITRWGKNETTIGIYLQTLRQFYKWMYHIPRGSTRCPEPVEDLFFIKKKGKRLFELPSEEQVAKLIANTDNILYKALFSTLYNTAGRIGEIATLRVRDVVFEKGQAVVHITQSKTDQRPVLLIDSAVSILQEWLSVHPLRDQLNFPDCHLFVSISNNAYAKPLTHPAIAKMLKKNGKKVGIASISAHKLRHWKATHMIMRGLNETKLKAILGHSFNSKATALYLHVASKDTFDSIRQIYHKEKMEIQIDHQENKTCAYCGGINDFSRTACTRCNRTLGLNNELPITNESQEKEMNDLKEKMMMLERSINILTQATRQTPPEAFNNPLIAKQVTENARINTTGGIQNG